MIELNNSTQLIQKVVKGNRDADAKHFNIVRFSEYHCTEDIHLYDY